MIQNLKPKNIFLFLCLVVGLNLTFFLGKNNLVVLENHNAEKLERIERSLSTLAYKERLAHNNGRLLPVQEELDKLNYIDGDKMLSPDEAAQLISTLAPYLEDEPPEPILHRIRDPPLRNVDCTNYPGVLEPEAKQHRSKVYDMFLFNYELDLLEIRLFELNSTVDKFVIVESTRTHRLAKKPLFYERNKARFQQFESKIIHLIIDDPHIYEITDQLKPTDSTETDYRLENFARAYLLRGFTKVMGRPNEDDIFISGDVNEIPGADIINHLALCEIKPSKLPLAIGSLLHRFNFDWIENPQNIWRYPDVFRFEHVIDGIMPRGTGAELGNVVPWSGVAVKDYGKPEAHLYQLIASSSEGGERYNNFIKNLDSMKPYFQFGRRPCCGWKNPQCVKSQDLLSKNKIPHLIIPWFAAKNKERFPDLFPDIETPMNEKKGKNGDSDESDMI